MYIWEDATVVCGAPSVATLYVVSTSCVLVLVILIANTALFMNDVINNFDAHIEC